MSEEIKTWKKEYEGKKEESKVMLKRRRKDVERIKGKKRC